MNSYAKQLINHKLFNLENEEIALQLVAVNLADLGFKNEATTFEIIEKARSKKLDLCPLETALYLRLHEKNQEEDNTKTKGQSPPGALTVLSSPLKPEDPYFPKGMYLRKMEGELWVRGYCADKQHKWKINDLFVFMKR